MKTRVLGLLGIFAAISLPAPASAASVFNFLAQVPGFGGGFIQASGTITCAVDLDVNSNCVATSITGTVTNPLIASGAPKAIVALSSFNGADQLLKYRPSNPSYPFHADLTLGGLSFTTSSFAFPLDPTYNWFSRGLDLQGRLQMRETNDGPSGGGANKNGQTALFQLDLVQNAVPEPSSWALMLVGFGAVGFGLRRSQRVRLFSPSLSRLAT